MIDIYIRSHFQSFHPNQTKPNQTSIPPNHRVALRCALTDTHIFSIHVYQYKVLDSSLLGTHSLTYGNGTSFNRPPSKRNLQLSQSLCEHDIFKPIDTFSNVSSLFSPVPINFFLVQKSSFNLRVKSSHPQKTEGENILAIKLIIYIILEIWCEYIPSLLRNKLSSFPNSLSISTSTSKKIKDPISCILIISSIVSTWLLKCFDSTCPAFLFLTSLV